MKSSKPGIALFRRVDWPQNKVTTLFYDINGLIVTAAQADSPKMSVRQSPVNLTITFSEGIHSR